MSATRPEPTTDISAARWLIDEIGAFESGVGGLVPPRFEAYARILHPAGTSDDEDVSWATVAAWSGKEMHPLVQFEAISRPRPKSPSGEPRVVYEPMEGQPDPDLFDALCEVLRSHTQTPELCWFCLWEGYGWIDGGSDVVVFDDSGKPSAPAEPPAFAPEIMSGPRVRLPERDYILLSGPLETAAKIGEWEDAAFTAANPDLDLPANSAEYQPPNLFWPDDRAWCVASEIDLYSTYVGGTEALIAELLGDPRLEAFRVRADDPVDESSDTINR